MDSRFPNAKVDIWQHTINKDAHPASLVVKDDRFQLLNGEDAYWILF